MDLVKEESQEFDLTPGVTNQHTCDSDPIGTIKWEDNKPVPLEEDHIENGFHLNVITLQEVKKEEKDVCVNETTLELSEKTHNVNKELSSVKILNDSFDNGLNYLATEGNLVNSQICTRDKPYQCSHCGKNFFRYDSLKSHTRNKVCFKQISTGKKYCCSHCGKTFATLIHFIVHQQIHRGDGRGERPFHCSQCGKRFYRQKGLEIHQQSHKGERSHSCSKCGKSFTAKSLLMTHQRSHTRERLYHCSKCSRSFASKTTFERHIHLEETLYSCTQCKKSFTTESSLNKHKQKHTRKETDGCFQQVAPQCKLYSCSHCSRTFTVLTHYIVHQQIHRGEGSGERPFCCLQCGKRFYREHGLKTHQQSHSRERVHCCSQCGKSFKTKSVLIGHKCSHLKKRLYQCLYCPRSFTLKSTFERHMQTHSREKRYSGNLSGKRISAELSFNRQKQTQIGKEQAQQMASKNKSYNCTHCGRTFTTLTNFIVHQQIHRGEGREERPYCCSQCGKRFYREGSLKKHQQTHTGGLSHHCSQCKKSFTRKSALLSHQNTHKREKPCYLLKQGGGFAPKSNSDEEIHMLSRDKVHSHSQCGEKFCTENFLKRHSQSHSKKRPNGCFKQLPMRKYFCSSCGRNFTTLTHFIEHQQIHRGNGRGDRPVYYTQRGKCFYKDSGLKSQKQIHVRETTGFDIGIQNSSRANVQSDICLQNTTTASKENSGRANVASVKDRERYNTNNKTLHAFDIYTHSIKNMANSRGLHDIQNSETYDGSSEKPLMAYDIIPPFCSEETSYTMDPVSSGSTPAIRPGFDINKTLRNGDRLNENNTMTSFRSADMSENSGELDFAMGKEEPMECDLKPEPKHAIEHESEMLHEIKQESNGHIILRDIHVFEDDQPQKNILEDIKKEEGEESLNYVVEAATEMNQNILYFNQEILSEPRQNHSSDCMKDFNTEGNVSSHQRNKTTEKTLLCSPWGESIEKDQGTNLQSPTAKRYSVQQIPTGNKTYCCSHCGRRFNTSMKYIVHLQIHRREGDEERPFSCSQCGKRFYREEGLKTHRQSHTGDRPASGPQNGNSSIMSGSTVLQHSHTAENLYHCSPCDKSFNCQKSFWAHQKIHAELRFSSCCDEAILKKQHGNTSTIFIPSSLNGHLSGETSIGQSHLCRSSPGPRPPVDDVVPPFHAEFPVCTVPSSGITNANMQITHNAERRLESEEISRGFGKIPLVFRTQPLHESILLPKLEQHDWESESKEQIRKEDNGHMSMRMDYAEETSQLKIITLDAVKMEEDESKAPTNLSSILNYDNRSIPTAERHNGFSAYAKTSENLAKLTPIHTERKYQCSHYRGGFIREGDLEIHKQSHKESCYFQQNPLVEKSYSCEHCGKSFASITNYFVHLQIHRGERPFSCSQCGKSYYKEESLKKHQQSHTEWKN